MQTSNNGKLLILCINWSDGLAINLVIWLSDNHS